jgi:4-hydroxy-3-methylbut-2-enyl diphosphate reductase
LLVKLAKSYGFCFGVKRAIKIAQEHKNSSTFGPLIHNQKEIDRLKSDFNVGLYHNIDEVQDKDTVIIRTHGIPKNHLQTLKQKDDVKVINATCPFVTTPQNIVKDMSNKGYSIVIFGDENHPEVQGVKSYANGEVYVVLSKDELENIEFSHDKIATVAQTTRKKEEYLDIINYLILKNKEVRVFNTICDATFENQAAARKLSKEVDIMIVIGGKNYHIEDASEIDISWFDKADSCGVTAGASTPDWIINQVVTKIENI